MRYAGLTLEQFDAQVAALKELALRERRRGFAELWLMVNVCSGRSEKYIRRSSDAKPLFVYVKRHIDRWDEVKKEALALVTDEQAKRRYYTYADAVAHSLERAEAESLAGHFEAAKPWLSITGAAYPANGTAQERVGWYKHECYYAQLVQENHLAGKRLNLLVTDGELSVPYAICTLRCPHCGRRVTDAACFAPLASQEECAHLKLAEVRGEL